MKARVQSAVARGKVDVFVTIARAGGDDVVVTVNETLARSYVEAIQKLHELGLGRARREYYPTDLARFPDVLTVEKRAEDLDEMKERLLSVLDLAIADFNSMREREGERLCADILGRASAIEGLLGEIEERSPQTVSDYRARLEAKMRELLEAGGAVGRKLDFLIQEFNREANTVGSKCSDLEITRRVVDMKAEIEKIREQVQNLE